MELDREHRAAVPWRLLLFQPESLSLHSLMLIWKSWLVPLHGGDHLYSYPSTFPLGCKTHHWPQQTPRKGGPCVIPECYSCTPGSRVSEKWDRFCMHIPSQITSQLNPITCLQAAQTLAPFCFEAMQMRTGMSPSTLLLHPLTHPKPDFSASASSASTVQ